MSVGLLLLECFIAESQSLKDQWQRARLAVVFVNTNWRMLQSTMSKLTEYVDRDGRVEITNTETRQLC
jgi:uncharacterized protein YlxP (DUF503 family)